ncbi:sortase domain-bontaining protein [Arthrobacter sp. ISL-69]|uniref:sortase domain-containing protein n=1 Tax=Arthrobacter sp. ISL-69 TaxID=2819113 RepID=UPI001BEAB48F|nr:sortase [Arthrobacter sp. ISL-69]MBT2538465.1 class F sortase [Arthrobacter sp. ISL-69]
MTTKNPGRCGRLLAPTAAGVLLLLSLAGCAAGTTDAGPAPAGSFAASASATSTAAPSPAAAAPSPAAPAAVPPAQQLPPVMGASAPVTLSIPTIGVRTDLLHLGLRENGSLEVPQDTGSGAPASWYNGSPTPGERGPSVILGHVNALGGNTGVFADLRKLTPGTEIDVTRTDGSVVVFTVDRGATYSKTGFPTLEVYGNTPGAELRLITCDGYDPATGLFDDNYVIYAKLKP